MYVYVIKPDMTVAMQPVEVAQMTEGQRIQTASARRPHLLSCQYRLQPGIT